jgi:hypothetical protein
MALQERDYGQSTSTSNWDFRDYHVAQDLGGQNAGRFATSEGLYLAAGPPRAMDSRSQAVTVMPIGTVDNVSINQNKMVQQMLEVGSRRSYFISSRVSGGVSLSRPLFNGPSLLRVIQGRAGSPGLGLQRSGPAPGLFPGGRTGVGEAVDENSPEFWGNLGSEVFDRPVGMFLFLMDQRNRPIAQMYLEECMVNGHGMNFSAQGISVPESIQMQFDRIIPVAINEI